MKDYTACIRLDNQFCPAFFNRALLHYDRHEYHKVREDDPNPQVAHYFTCAGAR